MNNCIAKHPQTGEGCTKSHTHVAEVNDLHMRQHATDGGLKWPHLSILDPSEGFNGPQPRCI
jgi:hypothetical protein